MCVCVCVRVRVRVCVRVRARVCVDQMNFKCAALWHIHIFISTFRTMPMYNV